MPAKATEKPRVEHRVFDLQRRWATPVPRVSDLAALNVQLLQCCLAEHERQSGDHADTVGVRFTQDRAAALPVPAHRFDACVLQAGQVDKYQTVRFDHNSYSVPRRWAFGAVTVKGYVDCIEVVAQGQVIAHHVRSYGRGERVLDPLHYLVTLERKPAALDHAPVYRDWQLPAAFGELRRALEQQLGRHTGSRHFIRVLQLLAQHPLARVEQAIALCQSHGALDAAAIAAQVERLAHAARHTAPAWPSSDIGMSIEAAALSDFQVPVPDLTRFNRLLSPHLQGEFADDATDDAAAQGQPQAAQDANYVVRV
jgi:hypothetical protein